MTCVQITSHLCQTCVWPLYPLREHVSEAERGLLNPCCRSELGVRYSKCPSQYLRDGLWVFRSVVPLCMLLWNWDHLLKILILQKKSGTHNTLGPKEGPDGYVLTLDFMLCPQTQKVNGTSNPPFKT